MLAMNLDYLYIECNIKPEFLDLHLHKSKNVNIHRPPRLQNGSYVSFFYLIIQKETRQKRLVCTTRITQFYVEQKCHFSERVFIMNNINVSSVL